MSRYARSMKLAVIAGVLLVAVVARADDDSDRFAVRLSSDDRADAARWDVDPASGCRREEELAVGAEKQARRASTVLADRDDEMARFVEKEKSDDASVRAGLESAYRAGRGDPPPPPITDEQIQRMPRYVGLASRRDGTVELRDRLRSDASDASDAYDACEKRIADQRAQRAAAAPAADLADLERIPGSMQIPEERARIAELRGRAEESAAARKQDKKFMRVVYSASICRLQEERREALADIAREKKYARIGGVIDKRAIYDSQMVIRGTDEVLLDVRAEMRSMRIGPLGCGDKRVRALVPCLATSVRNPMGECSDVNDYVEAAPSLQMDLR